MSRISKQSVYNALRRAGDHIITAAGDDPFVSRADMRQKLKTLSGTEASLVDMFYRFIDARDAKPRARVTAKDVEAAIEYAEEKLIAQYDLNNNGLSKAEIERMSTTGKLAVSLAWELKVNHGKTHVESEEAWINTIDELVKGVIYYAIGSEAGYPLEAVYFPTSVEAITYDSIVATLGLDTSDPTQDIYSIEPIWTGLLEPARVELDRFNGFDESSGIDTFEVAENVNTYADQHLRSLYRVQLGLDIPEIVEHPLYRIGLTDTGAIAGVKTIMNWPFG